MTIYGHRVNSELNEYQQHSKQNKPQIFLYYKKYWFKCKYFRKADKVNSLVKSKS